MYIYSVGEHRELKQTLGPMRFKSLPVALSQNRAGLTVGAE